DRLLAIAAEHQAALLEALAADLQRIGDVRERQLGTSAEVLQEGGRGARERRLAARRERQRLPAVHDRPWPRRRRLLEHQVRVRAAEAERADAGAPRYAGGGPRTELGVDVDRARGEVDLGVRRGEMEARRQLAVA